MAELAYHQMLVQHIKYLDQHRSLHPVRLVHQPPQQSLNHGARHPWAARSHLHLAGVQPTSGQPPK